MSITVKLPDELAALLAEEATPQSLTPDELAALLAEHIPTPAALGFVAIGESTSGRTAAEAEEMLACTAALSGRAAARANPQRRPYGPASHTRCSHLSRSHRVYTNNAIMPIRLTPRQHEGSAKCRLRHETRKLANWGKASLVGLRWREAAVDRRLPPLAARSSPSFRM